jgi:hypothetical protein
MNRPRAVTSIRTYALAAATLWAAWLAVAGAQVPSGDLPFGERASFRLDKATLRARSASAALLEKLDATAFRYFRMLAREFAARTCFEFRDLRWRLPSVAVHGDAHLEQFVITGHSYGLEDFDAAGFGPSVVDLVRYATSLRIACRDATWACNGDEAVELYLEAYHEALDHRVDRVAPTIVARLRSDVVERPYAWLERAVSQVRPIPADGEATFRKGWARFIQLMRDTRPDRPESFYDIVRVGSVEIGVGSALEPKTLIRIAGPTSAAEDDLILEARISAMPTGYECVAQATSGGSLQVLMFTALLGPRLPDVFGFLPREGQREAPEYWVQSWDPGYREVAASEVTSQAELNELAVDAARQLAGHFWTTFPEPLRGQQRFAQLRAFEMTHVRARNLSRILAEETVREWQRFREQR